MATPEPYMKTRGYVGKTGGMDRVPGTSGDAIGFWEPGEGGGGKCL